MKDKMQAAMRMSAQAVLPGATLAELQAVIESAMPTYIDALKNTAAQPARQA